MSKDLEKLIELKNKEIDMLKFNLEHFDSIQRGKCCECERNAIQDLSDMHFKIMPFEDEYFNGLTYNQIAELAKKSLRLTALNSELENKIEEIRELYFLSQSKTQELGFSAFKQYFDETFSIKLFEIIKDNGNE